MIWSRSSCRAGDASRGQRDASQPAVALMHQAPPAKWFFFLRQSKFAYEHSQKKTNLKSWFRKK